MATTIELQRQCLLRAETLAEGDSDMLYDICAEYGQMLANVRHMTWFKHIIADTLIDTVKKYKGLPYFSKPDQVGGIHSAKYRNQPTPS